MDFATVSKLNPSIIYASVTGYGQTGPYRRRAGYDVMVEAEMGLMHITGPRDGPPVKVGVAVTDLTTGLYASNSIMAALIGRARTGKGQHIDVALSDCQVATLANFASSALISGEPDKGRWGTAHRKLADLSFTRLFFGLYAQCQLNFAEENDCLTQPSVHRPLLRLPNLRWRHPARRRQRSPLRHPVQLPWQTRMGVGPSLSNQQRPRP